MGDPTKLLFTLLAGSRYVASGAGVGPMLFDPTRRQLVMSGCFQRFLGTGAGEPATGRCSGISNNFLRFLDVDSQANATVQIFDMYGDVLSLWATMRSPDTLVKVELPPQPSVAPRVRRIVPLPLAPADLVRIPRGANQPDLIAVIAEKTGQLAIYDVAQEQIVAQVGRLGDSPFSLKVLSNDGVTARLAAAVFDSCSVALVEVPLDAPWNAELRGRLGRCP